MIILKKLRVRGVIFTGFEKDKGQALIEFFRATGFTPERVVYVDNDIEQVRKVQSALAAAHISFLGFNYLHKSLQQSCIIHMNALVPLIQ